MIIKINPVLANLYIFNITLFISFFLKKTSQGISVGIGIVFVMYLLNIMGNLSKKIKFLKYISIFYYTDSRTIITESKIALSSVLVVLISSFVITLLSYNFYNKKELGK